jgi:hypothetical protein
LAYIFLAVKIDIHLNAEAYGCLLNHIPESSAAHLALENAERIAGAILPAIFIVPCEEDQLRILLKTARQHCPWAASGIENQITLFWLNR